MNPSIEKIPETGSQRRKSIASDGGSNLAGGKARRHSIGITSSQTSTENKEGNIIPYYLRASTGSCHDFCKFGKKHEHSKSTVPIKFKRTTIVNKDKVVPKTVVPLEKKKPSTKPVIETRIEPVKVTKKDVLLLSSKKPQVYKQSSSSTNGKTTRNEVKTFGEIKKKDIKTVKTGALKKVVAKVIPNESRGVKKVTPLKDQKIQNRMQKTEPKQTIADKNVVEEEVKPETMEFDFMDLVNPPVCNSSDSVSDKNVVEESPIIHPVYKSSELYSDKQVLEELLVVETSKSCLDKEVLEEALITPPVSESSESFYDDGVLENESDYTNVEEVDNINEMETSVGNLPRKGKMVISEDKDDEAVKLSFNYDGEVLENESNHTDDEEAADVNEMENSVGNHKIPRKGKMVILEDKDDEAVYLRFNHDDEVLENESDYTDDEEAANVNEMETSVGNHKIPRKGKMVISEDKDDEAVKLSFTYDGEVLEHEFNCTDDEEAANVNEMDTSVGNHKISRKGKMVILVDKDEEVVKLRFRRGKILDLQSDNNNNTPRRLKFRRRVIDGNEIGQNISRKTYKTKTLDDLKNEEKERQRVSRRSFEKKHVEETNETNNGHESVVLKHQGEQEKKDGQGLLNNVIEETASKLVESRKSKVKALVGAFETVISLQDGKPSSS